MAETSLKVLLRYRAHVLLGSAEDRQREAEFGQNRPFGAEAESKHHEHHLG